MWPKSRKWCCSAFQKHFEAAGNVGFWVTVERWPSGEPKFILRHQAVDAQEAAVSSADLKIEIIGEALIEYCPWCGSKLSRHFGSKVDSLYREEFTLESFVSKFQT